MTIIVFSLINQKDEYIISSNFKKKKESNYSSKNIDVYLGFEKDVVEAADRCIRGDLHFQLKLKEKPLIPGSPEFLERVEEVERLMSIND